MGNFSLRLDDTVEQELQRISRKTSRTKSDVVKKALTLYLDEYQDYEAALVRRAKKGEEILTLTQMKKALGI